MELHRAGKEYLKTILALEQKNGSVRSLDVARTLHVTKPSVSKAMKHLREGGYLTMDADKRICLTKAGREAAEQAADTHHILKSCLIAMGIDPATAEQDACKMEHAVSPRSLEEMKRFIERKAGSSY
ncbi:MAG: metal-dependent transcriptional regulator [Clostridia bacterium]|nr:metal-dependent transcriptional regulator [Clostridia bacterium]